MNLNRTTLRDRCRIAMTGIDKHLASDPAIPVGDGVSHAAADVKKALQTTINAADATQLARGEWIDAARLETSMRTSTRALLVALQGYVVLKFGNKDVSTLADFGFTPRKQTPQTVETKVAAAQKRAATRLARHTTGPKAKAKVKGAVPTPETKPVTPPAPAGPVPAAVTAPAAPVIIK